MSGQKTLASSLSSVDPEYLRQLIEQLCGQTQVFSDQETAVRFLEEFYASLGLSTTRYQYGRLGAPRLTLFAEIPGDSLPEKILVVGSRFGSTSGGCEDRAHGTDDYATNTAAAMSIAREIVAFRDAGYKFAYTIRVLHCFGEETGRSGIASYVEDIREAGDEVIGTLQLKVTAANNGSLDALIVAVIEMALPEPPSRPFVG